jgi:hypothetical protein
VRADPAGAGLTLIILITGLLILLESGGPIFTCRSASA